MLYLSPSLEKLIDQKTRQALARGNSLKPTRSDSLCLVKDILMTEGPSTVIIVRQGGFYIVKEIVHMFEHFTREDESGDESHCPLFCG